MPPSSSALLIFVRCCAASRRTRKPEHFRRKQPPVPAKPEGISRIFPAFKRALLRSHRLSADCGRSARKREDGHTVITRDEKGVSVCCILRFPAPRPRFGTLPCVRTAAERSCRRNALRILRQRTVQKSRYGRGPAMLLRPSIFTNNTATGPTDGLPPCCNIIKEKSTMREKNYRNSE